MGFGRQVVVAGLAPAGTPSVTLVHVGAGERRHASGREPDGSFTVRFRAAQPGTFRAVAARTGALSSSRGGPRVTVARAGSSDTGRSRSRRGPAPASRCRPTPATTSPGAPSRARDSTRARGRASRSLPPARRTCGSSSAATAGWADASTRVIASAASRGHAGSRASGASSRQRVRRTRSTPPRARGRPPSTYAAGRPRRSRRARSGASTVTVQI